jgi:hypothetical protein
MTTANTTSTADVTAKPLHTLSKGTPVSSKSYGKWGSYAGKRVYMPLRRGFTIVVGEPKSGKSSLLQSGEGLFILNFDRSSQMKPQAMLWPALDPDLGSFVDDAGQPFELDWTRVQGIVSELVKAAKNNEPRPDTVVFDSLPEGLKLLRPYLAAKYGKESFSDLGMAGYTYLADEILGIVKQLRSVGYGIVMVIHLLNKRIPVGDDRYVRQWDVNITPSLWQALFPMAEAVVAVVSGYETRMREFEQVLEIPGHPPRRVVRKVEERVRVVKARFRDEEIGAILGGRVESPDIELPEEGAWTVFETAYNSAREAAASRIGSGIRSSQPS